MVGTPESDSTPRGDSGSPSAPDVEGGARRPLRAQKSHAGQQKTWRAYELVTLCLAYLGLSEAATTSMTNPQKWSKLVDVYVAKAHECVDVWPRTMGQDEKEEAIRRRASEKARTTSNLWDLAGGILGKVSLCLDALDKTSSSSGDGPSTKLDTFLTKLSRREVPQLADWLALPSSAKGHLNEDKLGAIRSLVSKFAEPTMRPPKLFAKASDVSKSNLEPRKAMRAKRAAAEVNSTGATATRIAEELKAATETTNQAALRDYEIKRIKVFQGLAKDLVANSKEAAQAAPGDPHIQEDINQALAKQKEILTKLLSKMDEPL